MTRSRRLAERRRTRRTLFLGGSVLVLVAAGVLGVITWQTAHSRASQAPLVSTEQVSLAPASAVAAESTPTTVPVGPSAIETATAAVVATATPPALPPLPEFELEGYLGKVLRSVPNDKHEVALTFDDGPGKDTQRVLEILREHEVKATFFVVGRRGWKQTDDLRAMVADGHEIGNHTWSHPEPGEVDESALDRQFERSQQMITKATGRAPIFARTRGGKYTSETLENLTARGLILLHWSIHSNDVEPSPSPEQIVRNAAAGATPGAIILLHETNPNTVEALPEILDTLERKGLKPVTLSQLVADDNR